MKKLFLTLVALMGATTLFAQTDMVATFQQAMGNAKTKNYAEAIEQFQTVIDAYYEVEEPDANQEKAFAMAKKYIVLCYNKLGGQARNLPKLINEVYESDHQMLIFPAGLCSRKIDGKIEDLEWTKSFIKMSRESGRDIVPIHFIGENSKRFYRVATWQKRLGLKFNFAMMMLPNEMYRSKGRKYKVIIGKPITIASIDRSKSDFEWAQDIRAKVYEL